MSSIKALLAPIYSAELLYSAAMRFFKLLACFSLLQFSAAATKRSAYVTVRNNTPNPIRAVTVLHKYSNNYKHRGDWDIIQTSNTSDSKLTVEYNTGFFTTGRDWWLVTWQNEDKTWFYYSDPKNLRRIFDTIEGISPGNRLKSLFNSESTTGFKQHILRKEDANQVTEIIINKDNTITFHSRSGDSSTGSSFTPVSNQKDSPQPFYAIAHRVLDKAGLEAALKHGANAIEVDATAWKNSNRGWWADHDGIPTSRGDKMSDFLTSVAEARRAGKNMNWLWFDLKNPDNCGKDDTDCNIEFLRDMARQILKPVNVKILWGFSGSAANGRAYKLLRDDLDANEAIGIDGLGGTSSEEAKKNFESGGPTNVAQRVWTNGYFIPSYKFGSCEDKDASATDLDICPQIRYGIMSKAFGKVFGWTISRNDVREANKLMYAGVDGLIYGHVASSYKDSAEARAALELITNWLHNNKDRRYLAELSDKPW